METIDVDVGTNVHMAMKDENTVAAGRQIKNELEVKYKNMAVLRCQLLVLANAGSRDLGGEAPETWHLDLDGDGMHLERLQIDLP